MKWCFYPHLNVFFLHFLQSVIQCAHRVRKREIQIWQNMNGNDRVLWWAALNLCNTEILIWSPTLPLDPGSPISSIYLKVNFIPTENWNLQKLSSSALRKKSHEIRFISPVALWKSGLPCLSVCYTSVYCKGAVATASHLRGEGLATNPYIRYFWANFEFDSCFTDLIWLRVALKMSGACLGHV